MEYESTITTDYNVNYIKMLYTIFNIPLSSCFYLELVRYTYRTFFFLPINAVLNYDKS